jgi:hypothetical protein
MHCLRDPWWIFTVCALFWIIKSRYEFTVLEIIRISPRFAIMLLAMFLSICFLIFDILSVTGVLTSSLPVGENPFWKLSYVFKCLTDSVILDDFKTALDRLWEFKMEKMNSGLVGGDNAGASAAALMRMQINMNLPTLDPTWDFKTSAKHTNDHRIRHSLDLHTERQAFTSKSCAPSICDQAV